MSSLQKLPSVAERRTTSETVFGVLREAIVAGRFEDGEELNQVELAEHFGVSRVPIREALRRLQAEGLISAEAHRRATVVGVTPHRISEILEVRAVLECHLLERGAPKLTAEAVADLRELCDRMDAVRKTDKWLALNHEFHRLLWGPDPNATEVAMVDQLSTRIERYVRLVGGVDITAEARGEHRAIVDALEQGDVSGARDLLEAHIHGTGRRIAEEVKVV